MRSPRTFPQGRDDRFIEFVVDEVFVFIKQAFLCCRLVNCATATSERGKEAVGRRALSRIQILVHRNPAKNPANLSRSRITRELRAPRTFVMRRSFGRGD